MTYYLITFSHVELGIQSSTVYTLRVRNFDTKVESISQNSGEEDLWSVRIPIHQVLPFPNGFNLELRIVDLEQNIPARKSFRRIGKAPSHEDRPNPSQLALEPRLGYDILAVLVAVDLPLDWTPISGYSQLEGIMTILTT